jgi:DsbE subfamily thiol:disulfide oxidoreductase
MKRLSVGVLVLALAGCGSKGAKTAADSKGSDSGHAEVGKTAPDLSIQSLNGKGEVSLEKLQGKIVVVDFWATWCGPCKQSFPKLEELSKKLGDKVEIVGVSCDDEKKGVLEFAKENGATFAIGWDEGHTLAQRWKVDNMPTTFIVDGTGTVRHVHNGYHGDSEAKEIEKEIAGLSDTVGSGSKVAKSDSKSEGKPEEKSEAKEEAKSEAKAEPPAEEEKPEPPKKKGGKKGAKPAGGKKHPKKKG